MQDMDGSKFTFTSTPHQRGSFVYNSTTTDASSQDMGYLTGNLSELSDLSRHPNRSSQSFDDVFGSDDDSLMRTPSNRTSFRGKRRFDIISGLLSYECSNLILRNMLSFLDFPTRLMLLQVCKTWYCLKDHIPDLFVRSPFARPDSKENFEERLVTKASGRTPLANIPIRTKQIQVTNSNTTNFKENLHPCPYCSGPAYHRPSEWPNRLHCQSSICGVSVCFNCCREHSPSERCPKVTESKSRQSTSSAEYTPSTESSRHRRKREKMALRRL